MGTQGGSRAGEAWTKLSSPPVGPPGQGDTQFVSRALSEGLGAASSPPQAGAINSNGGAGSSFQGIPTTGPFAATPGSAGPSSRTAAGGRISAGPWKLAGWAAISSKVSVAMHLNPGAR